MSTKLDTVEAVLEWAVTQGPVERDWGMEMGEDTETAAYIAECVRLRRVVEEYAKMFDPEGGYSRFHDALADAGVSK